MGWQNLAQRKPPGASCNWTKEEIAAGAPYRWWRPASGQGCTPLKLRFRETVGNVYVTSVLGNGGSINLSSCGFTSYMAAGPGGSGVDCDVWAALQAGAWTSSVVFTIYITRNTGSSLIEVGAGTATAGVFTTPYASATNSTNPATATCGTLTPTAIRTVTLYDDGRITLV